MFDSVKAWISTHRTAVIVTLTMLATAGTVIVLLINGKKVEIPVAKLAENFNPDAFVPEDAVAQTLSVEIDGVAKSFPRRAFIRKLPEGLNPSIAKQAEAKALHIELKPGETYVHDCIVTKRVAA